MPEWFIQLAVGTAVTGIIALVINSIKQQNAAQQKELDELREKFNEKCEFQQSQVTLLFQKHDEDVERLRGVEMRIASDHYIKPELDAKFEKIEVAVRQGFQEVSGSMKGMGDRFDALAHQLISIASNGNGMKK